MIQHVATKPTISNWIFCISAHDTSLKTMRLIFSQVSFEILKQRAKQVNDERVGATTDIEWRRGEYEWDGYSGTMYYFKTENMKKAEDK